MTKPTLDSIAAAKAKLEEELLKLHEQEADIRQQQVAEAFAEAIKLLGQYSRHFSTKQKAEIASFVISGSSTRGKNAPGVTSVAPKYWLPHTQDTWSGRGRPPRAFTAWEGTAAHKEWKAQHPTERFPKFPG